MIFVGKCYLVWCFGGDEFVVLLCEVCLEVEVQVLCQVLME